jgi:hypothetical protein
MKFKIIILIQLLAVSVINLKSQTVNGYIYNEHKEPLIGAHIQNISQGTHAHTNKLGYFELAEVSENDTLQISYIGYEMIEEVISLSKLSSPLIFQLEEDYFQLDQVQVVQSIKHFQQVASLDLETNPVRNAQEVLRKVPGLVIAQHAGGGKAEQIFLRGFDIDHGTDIQITVDGMPVNMVSHAHGQGYADLHFLIPETIDNIDFGKGPYYADKGNFATAGYVDFETKDHLDQSLVSLEYGQFQTQRILGMFNLLSSDQNSKDQDAYIAISYLSSDGPFESTQDFNRLNLFGKFTQRIGNDRLSVQLSHFQSKWDASGQIPQRLVDNGTISRFGAVDDTEGGQTSRSNINLQYVKSLATNRLLKTRVFFSQYDFDLYSNFTFFLNDPINGDQIYQSEERSIFGMESILFQNIKWLDSSLDLRAGIGLRYDDVNENELSRTLNRKTTLSQLAFGNIDEHNIYGFIDGEWTLGKWLINPGLRVDAFHFSYQDELQEAYTNLSEQVVRLSPKFNVLYQFNNRWQMYLKSGMGFHSNDARVAVQNPSAPTVPFAAGADLGTIWKPNPRVWINTALWYLFLEQEFVYVGDEAVVEPSGETQRMGVDLGLKIQLSKRLFFDADINYTYARSIEEPEGEDYIPLAPDLTSSGGLTWNGKDGFSGGIRYRYVKDRPANEDGSITAQGFFIVDANANYTFKNMSIGVQVENLLDQEWNEAQFATESLLRGEDESVEEIHFTPGVPFFVKGSIQYRF